MEVQQTLPKASSQLMQPTPHTHVNALELSSLTEQLCLSGNSEFGLDDDSKATIMRLYKRQVGELRRNYHQIYSEAVHSLKQIGRQDESFLEAFRVSVQKRFTLHCRSMWEAVSTEVKSFCIEDAKSGQASEGSGHKHTSSYNPEKGAKYNRGHDTDAVRILEQAFQQTQNITQAEKYRLAEVTGLHPKQVTIWVSFFFPIDASRYFAPSQHTQTRPSGDEGHVNIRTIAMVITHMLSRWHDLQQKAEPRHTRQQHYGRCSRAGPRADHSEISLCSAFPLS